MKQVLFIPEVRKYFENLVPLLYEMDYFSYLDISQKYVKELIDDIVANLPTKLHKPAPAYFDQYGTNMEYAGFRKNRYTTWYVFFTVYRKNGEEIYLVRYIANNHVIARYL